MSALLNVSPSSDLQQYTAYSRPVANSQIRIACLTLFSMFIFVFIIESKLLILQVVRGLGRKRSSPSSARLIVIKPESLVFSAFTYIQLSVAE